MAISVRTCVAVIALLVASNVQLGAGWCLTNNGKLQQQTKALRFDQSIP